MIKFSSLSKGQKRCILALIEQEPRLKTARKVTRKDVVAVWENLRDLGSKVGFPNWLLNSKFKVEDGYYAIPKPTAKDIEEYQNPKPKPKTVRVKKVKEVSEARKSFVAGTMNEEDMEYYSTLEKYQIPF